MIQINIFKSYFFIFVEDTLQIFCIDFENKLIIPKELLKIMQI
jgi:hypothetical protein